MCSSMLSIKFLVYSKWHSAHSKDTKNESSNASSSHLQEVKNNGKSLTVRPKKWSRSLTGCGHLQEVPTVRLWLGKFWCFGLATVYGRRSLTRGGRTWRFDCTVKQRFVPESVWSHKCLNIFNFGLVFIFTGTHWFWTGTHDFSQDESKDSC